MKIYIMADIEGISGIYTTDQVTDEGNRYQEGRRLMTREVNVVAKALKDAGVEEVYYRDCHYAAQNVIWEELSSDVDVCISGAMVNTRFPKELDECDGVILLGYHAKAGTRGALLEHSMSSKGIQNYFVEGKTVGEIFLDAAIVGDRGKPVIMVSGDDHACSEAKETLPWVVTAEVKRAVSCQGAAMLTPKKAEKLIYEKTVEAVKNLPNCKPLVIDKPVRLTVEAVERTFTPNIHLKPYMEIHDGRTFTVTGDTMEEALFRTF